MCCCGWPLILFLLLIPFALFALSHLEEERGLVQHINDKYIEKYLAVGLDPATLATLKDYAHQSNRLGRRIRDKSLVYASGFKEAAGYFFGDYVPKLCDSALERIYSATKNTADYLYDFKPSEYGGHDVTSSALNMDSGSEIMREMRAVKVRLTIPLFKAINNIQY